MVDEASFYLFLEKFLLENPGAEDRTEDIRRTVSRGYQVASCENADVRQAKLARSRCHIPDHHKGVYGTTLSSFRNMFSSLRSVFHRFRQA